MIILDTQHVSQLQRAGSKDAATLEFKLRAVSPSEARITVVTPFEQFKAVLGQINAAGAVAKQVVHFALFLRLLEYYASQWLRTNPSVRRGSGHRLRDVLPQADPSDRLA